VPPSREYARTGSRDDAERPPALPAALRWLDFVALVVALPIFLAADLPVAGYLVGGFAWVAQRLVQVAVARHANAADDPRTIVGLAVGSMILRGWMVALSIFLVGLSDKDAGLAAAVLVVSLFTIYFAVQLAVRPFDRRLP
jgi:hypothetical protein